MNKITDIIGITTITIIVIAIYPLLVLGDAVWLGLHRIWRPINGETD